MKYLFTRKEKLISEAKINFSPDFHSGAARIFKNFTKTPEMTKGAVDFLRTSGTDIDSKKMKKDEYTLSIGSKPNMVKIDDKTEIKFGRLLSILTPQTPDHVKSEMVNMWKAYFDFDNRGDFELIDENIDEHYDCSGIGGTLGASCMAHSDSQTFEIYNKNDSIKLLVLLDSDFPNGDTLGRSIIFFDTNLGAPVMNRVYTIDETDVTTFKMYAEKKGWVSIDDLNVNELEVNLEHSDFEKYPYIDNVPYLNKTKKILSGSWEKWRGSDDEIIKLEDHEYGFWYPIQNAEHPGGRDWKSQITSWEDAQWCFPPEYIINNGIDYKEFLNGFISDEIEYKIEAFDDFYTGDDFLEFLPFSKIYKDNNWLSLDPWIRYSLKNGYDIKEFLFKKNDISINDMNGILSHFYEEDRVYKSRDQQEKIVDDILVHNSVELVESVISKGHLSIDGIKKYIEENYKEIIDNNDLMSQMVESDLKRHYSTSNGFHTVTDIMHEMYGTIHDLNDVKHLLNGMGWNRDKFIDYIEEQGDVDELTRCLFGE